MMTSRQTSLAIPLVVLALAPAAGARQQAPPRTAIFTEGVTAVLVDVVVRDRKGQPVRDLIASDFEVTEDGVPQAIGSFTQMLGGERAVSRTPAAGVTTGPATPAVAGLPSPGPIGPPVTALVFHGLSTESRRRAVLAARAYVGDTEETGNYIGVFGIDLSLHPLVPFTRNGVRVREALTRIATGTGGSLAGLETEPRVLADQSTGASAPSGTGPGSGPGYLKAIEARMMDAFMEMQLDQQGYIATDALAAMIATLARLPGRKSLVLFSEGIAVTAAVHPHYVGVLDAANRANVSIYTIDAAGLRVTSPQAAARDSINDIGARGVETSYTGESSGPPLTKALEMNEYTLRSNPRWNLGTLAQDTGGLLFDGSNNLRPAFERIDSDLRNYYLLGYTPLNRTFDGKFRTIQVKVKRRDVTVAARKGYFAVRNPGTVPINPWEATALGALEQKPIPNAFPVRAAALAFPERGRPGLVPVIVRLKTAPLTFQPDADGKSYTSDFTVLVRFLDHQNQVVRKISQHYEIRGDVKQMDRARQGEVVFYRESELPPGVYSMETVVHDALSNKSSARFSTVEVARHQEGQLRMSSVVLVTRGEEVPEKDRRPDTPLVVNGVALQPNLEGAVNKAQNKLTFFFTVYPAGATAPEVTIQLLQNGKVITHMPMAATAAAGTGRIQQLGRLPLADIPPGLYQLRAVARQGSEQIDRSTMVRIE